ncbi:hypothetical protein LJC56_04805 [Christensenellaceae bacterium OttesenSCG-928-K19]|nr:hypothetical protein [Christensenellaceae bacterium OttesenSCG-928-K19]
MNAAHTKSEFKKLLPYFVILCIIFYALPFPSLFYAENASYLITTLLIINPAICFVLHVVYALYHGFKWYIPLLSGALFVPTIFIFYNETATLYTFSYIVLSFIGAAVGYSFYKNRKKNSR